MAIEKANRLWLPAILLMFLVIVIGLFIIWLRYSPPHAIEVTITPDANLTGTVYVTGAVANPGIYSFSPADSIESLITAAGGTNRAANISNIKLTIESSQNISPQKVDINRAEAWLLAALPGVGETLAQRIIDYRKVNGLFRATSDLMKVSGMGSKTFQQVEGLITVGD